MRRYVLSAAFLAALLFIGGAKAQETLPYAQAVAAWQDIPRAEEPVAVDIFRYQAEDVGLTEIEINGERALAWRTNLGSVTFPVSVPESGLYWIQVRYAQLDAASGQIERGVLINGESPFLECDNFYFPKRFRDREYPYEKNEYGNEIRPHQEGVEGAVSILLRERNEFFETPLCFYLQAGENTLTLVGVKGAMALLGITLTPPEEMAADITAPESGGELVMEEAEHVTLRSSKSIQNLSVSEPGITPSDAGYKLLNCIGGENWDTAGDYLEWNIAVEKDGWYTPVFHYKQNFNTAMTSYRRLEIDGEIPSAAYAAMAFPFSSAWTQSRPGGDVPAYVYLTAGNHTLRLTSVNAPYRLLYERLSAVVSEMKEMDLRIKEIIGNDSDVYRIWKLEKYIPSIAEDLRRLTEESRAIAQDLSALLGNTENLGALTAAIGDLERLAGRHNDIAKQTDALSLIYTVFSDWQEYMLSQPILLDKIYLEPAGQKAPAPGAGIWEKIRYSAVSFFRSFFNSGEQMLAEDSQSVTVWVQRNRDYVDMMQLLADEFYTKETGVKINVSYCPPGSQLLVLAKASGNQPDIVSGVDIALPFDFGIRNALVDLSQMDGFDQVVAPIAPGSRIPYYFSGAEYGLAETINVKVMFCRTDVLDRLDIPTPETWTDTVNALSTLLQNHYALYYPYGDYLTFFFQNNVDVYSDDGLRLAFTDENGMSVFRQWTDLYVKYGLQPAMSSFYQHFRIGDVPLGITELDQYIQFDLAAPDISGVWEIAPVPGTYNDAGVLQRWQAGTQTGAIMFKTNGEREARAWDFLKWWLSTETQALYADYMENYFGEEFRWLSANPDVVASEAWPEEAKQVILEQLRWYKQLPMVPGGSYITSRELWNAWTRIVVDHGNYREEIEESIEDIELEISIKQQELGYIDENGEPLIPMRLMRLDQPAEKEE